MSYAGAWQASSIYCFYHQSGCGWLAGQSVHKLLCMARSAGNGEHANQQHAASADMLHV